MNGTGELRHQRKACIDCRRKFTWSIRDQIVNKAANRPDQKRCHHCRKNKDRNYFAMELQELRRLLSQPLDDFTPEEIIGELSILHERATEVCRLAEKIGILKQERQLPPHLRADEKAENNPPKTNIKSRTDKKS